MQNTNNLHFNVYNAHELWFNTIRAKNPQHYYRTEEMYYPRNLSRQDMIDNLLLRGMHIYFGRNDVLYFLPNALVAYGNELNNDERVLINQFTTNNWFIIQLSFSYINEDEFGSPPDDLEDILNKNKMEVSVLSDSKQQADSVYEDIVKAFNLTPIKDRSKLYTEWAYLDDKSQIHTVMVEVKPVEHFYPECYPYINDMDQYIKDFVNSTANILIMLGPPGLGKSSLVRHILHKNKWKSYIAYDEKIMTMDQYYVSFIQDKSTQVMVLEDADILLQSRIETQNRVMSKLLNISDGIVNFNKKFIFTANLSSVKDIDSALVRPGRCYDVLQFRELTLSEAEKACQAANLELPFTKDSYSVAELFMGTENVYQVNKQQIGFR